MYSYQNFFGEDAIEFCKLNLTLPDNVDMASVVRVETYNATFADDGDDFCEVRVIDNRNQIVHIDRVLSFQSPRGC